MKLINIDNFFSFRMKMKVMITWRVKKMRVKTLVLKMMTRTLARKRMFSVPM